MKTIPAAIAAAAVPASASTAAFQEAAPPDVITADSLGVAQQIAGVNLPVDARESARPIVVRNREHYQRLREVSVPSETEPAFSFRPPRPRVTGVATPASRRVSLLPAARTRKIAAIEDLAFDSVRTLAPLLASRQITSLDLTRLYVERLKRRPFLDVRGDTHGRSGARPGGAGRQDIRAGRYRGPLHGVPYGIKDVFATKGVVTTWGAQPYANQVFDYDATTVTRLREAGAVLVAKLSTGELAVGDLWFRGRTRNPWNPERGSNGSSAGPAAGHRSWPCRICRRHRNGRVDHFAGEHLWRRRLSTDVRTYQPSWLHDTSLDARQGRATHPISA